MHKYSIWKHLKQYCKYDRLRHALDLTDGSGTVTRRMKRERSHSSLGREPETEDSSSPGSSPKQRPQVVARSLSSEMTDSGLGQDSKNVNLSRQKLIKGFEYY